MSAVLDTPLNGLGMIPLVSDVEGLGMSQSYREALNTVVSACRGTSRTVKPNQSVCYTLESSSLGSMQRYVPLSIRLSATRAVGLWEKIIIMIILVNIEIMIMQTII